MQPETTVWTCPTCGGTNDEGGFGGDLGAAPQRRRPRGRGGNRTLLVLGAVVLVAVIAGIVLLAGDDGGETTSVDPAVEAATTQLCDDIEDAQVFRTDALRRTGESIANDADALRTAGADELADRADQLSVIYLDLSEAVANAEDASALNQQLIDLLVELPC